MTDILQEQIAYYRARASEYDQWALRQGRYDYGPELNKQWADQVAEVRAALLRCEPVDSALELACGTGIWTQTLLTLCARIHALDAAPEMLAINRAKLQSERVTYEQTDLFTWQPQQQYDLVFCGLLAVARAAGRAGALPAQGGARLEAGRTPLPGRLTP